MSPTTAPSWNLDDLYKGLEDPAIQKDLQEAQEEGKRFVQDYEGRLALLKGDELAEAIGRDELLIIIAV